jgi:hypothetical protein
VGASKARKASSKKGTSSRAASRANRVEQS